MSIALVVRNWTQEKFRDRKELISLDDGMSTLHAIDVAMRFSRGFWATDFDVVAYDRSRGSDSTATGIVNAPNNLN